ncbi:hypothetical protein COCC4DRAFT_196659 [Bipolaris maydis ATCC 48331]|uniref:Zn(2)-C6 fungal-type domain-containing protein n=1 Tax=Cochliobolus heterostrophus (strain C4 / ATCC 48331 / race T) TaxID=665024 RepID=N4XHE3_COCH4|nr:uncharacterized protein COCC4DRAFT_196659 [Bipolaris maydis ATCC 48331]ENI04527.1 hypothetical protein COCC4DRAFT_196659 [Bipolaris maydis ATCC 48331]KAJ5056401.1 fungal-specific transcription factor domain-containing protein [Bipolaris maydis]KAJ6270081.1 fungal-specific transcription factor domain-containing protein [Bipolaris maydis]
MASTPTTTTQRSRQLPGLACDECRRRKLRCDRVQPQCGVCRDSATTCVTTTTRQPRGPKRGHLRALQSRIVALERRLSSDRTSEDTTDDDFIRLPDDLDTFATPGQQPFSDLVPQDARDFFEKEASSSDLSHNFEVDSLFSQLNSAMPLPITRLSPVDFISEPMRSDLSHLYFDRVHSFFPILNKRHYFERARRSHYEQEDEAFYCLQHAMWNLAVSTSSQFQHIQDDLYAHTHRMVENLEQRYLNAECMRLEQVQARALLTIYEFMRVGYRKAWMSAGKCFRFAMLMKLHNIDGRDGVASLLLQNLTFVEIEERRRTFWMAYTIDRIISLLDRLVPVTFDQHTILTRLPCPEKEFQSDEPTVMDFLPSPLLVSESRIPCTFTDSIQLVAICGQLLSHQQQGVVEHAQGLISLGFWDRQQQLDARLEQAIQGMALNDPYALIFQDPMAYFTVLAAQASSLMLFKSSQIAPWGTAEGSDVIAECEKRAMAAAHQMIMMSKALVELSYFKIHPFTPVLLHFCGDFLISNHHLDPTFEMRLTLQTVLQALSPVNVIAQECIDRLRIVD